MDNKYDYKTFSLLRRLSIDRPFSSKIPKGFGFPLTRFFSEQTNNSKPSGELENNQNLGDKGAQSLKIMKGEAGF